MTRIACLLIMNEPAGNEPAGNEPARGTRYSQWWRKSF